MAKYRRIRDKNLFSAKSLSFMLAGLFIGLTIAFFLMNHRAKVQITDYAESMFGLPVQIESVNLSYVSNTVKIRNIRIANPPGFEAPHVLKVGELRIAAKSLTARPLPLSGVEVRGLDLFAEQNNAGETNLAILFDRILQDRAAIGGPDVTVALNTIRIKDIRLHPTGEAFGALDKNLTPEPKNPLSARTDIIQLSPQQLVQTTFEFIAYDVYKTLLAAQVKAGITETQRIGREIIQDMKTLAEDIENSIRYIIDGD